MRRRLTTCVLAAFYLMQATWLLHAGVDLLFPRLQHPVSTPDACCTRSCGCPEEAQRNRTCCCSKDAPSESTAASAPQPISSIEEARCKGVESALAQALTQPVVCSVAWVSLPARVVSLVTIPDPSPVPPPLPAALEKVPISRA